MKKVNNYRFLIIFIILIFFNNLSAQEDTIWDKGTDQEKLENIFRILSDYYLPPEKQIFLSLQAREIALRQNDKKSYCLSYKYLGNGYFSKSDYENAIKLYTATLQLAGSIKDLAIISDCYYNLSFAYKSLGNYPEALKNSKIAFEMDYARNDSAAMAESYNSIGIIYEEMGDYDKAQQYYLRSLQILEEKKNFFGIAQRYNNIGIIFYNVSNFEKAKEFLLKSIDLFEKLDNLPEKCKPMLSLGDLYERTGKYDSSLILYEQVLTFYKQTGDKSALANVLTRLGDVYFVKGEYNNALNHYNQFNLLKQEIKDIDGIMRAQTSLAKVYFQMNNIPLALEHLKVANSLWNKVKSKKALSDIYELYYNIYKRQQDMGKALIFFELHSRIKDSMISEYTNNKIYELQTIYETEKKEKENAILRQSNQIQILELNRNKTIRNFVILIALLILILSIFVYSRYRTKLKTNQILNEKNQLLEWQKMQISQQKLEIETKNTRITDSITYASLIQESMLPNRQILTDAFPDSFILFRPRDIVSGDFYWFQIVENKMVIAVADCTGHGIPAAFMSMLGFEILSEIFEEKKIEEPHIALNHLRESIKKVMNQEKTGNEDGMDIAICIIDKTAKIIEFASARRPLLYVEGSELKEIRGDKLSIGGLSKSNLPFSKHTIHYNLPISVYLFSDGYHDQFGGPHNGKITYNLFKELLYLNSVKPMKDQKEHLSDFLTNWKGDTIQIDDILVLGLKIE